MKEAMEGILSVDFIAGVIAFCNNTEIASICILFLFRYDNVVIYIMTILAGLFSGFSLMIFRKIYRANKFLFVLSVMLYVNQCLLKTAIPHSC